MAALVYVPAVASAAPITIDNFESGNLNAWKSGSSGQIIVDPLNAANHVLHFTVRGDGGDIWTANTYAATGNDWWFSFDYLGQPTSPNNVPGLDSGGAIGWDTDQSYAGNERWLGATTPVPVPSADALLIDDGAWHHYVIHLVRGVNLTNGPVYFKAEDWVRSDAVAGNAYFDNIAITDVNPLAVPVPEPGTLLLLAAGFGLLVTRRR
ncbi:MAG TPA: PEP-CTERM sorting domain-containing protein [Vicinamibacterales bacterium]|nr:PEP-CTERM sorting domain-containing protein [Vicinamibacterales bacterium]